MRLCAMSLVRFECTISEFFQGIKSPLIYRRMTLPRAVSRIDTNNLGFVHNPGLVAFSLFCNMKSDTFTGLHSIAAYNGRASKLRGI